MSSIVEIIAKELNISTASVSRALNDRPGVGEALRARILEKASQMNYAPSALARGLATSKTFALGFFVHEKPGLPPQNDPFYGRIMRGAEQALAHHHGTFQLTDEAIDAPLAALNAALDQASILRERFVALKPGQVFEF